MNSKKFDNWLNVSSKNFHKGINFGHKSIALSKNSYWHPMLSEYFLGRRDHVSVFNTKQTLKCFLRAFHVIALILKQKGRLLIINTHPEFWRLCTNFTQSRVSSESQLLESDSCFSRQQKIHENLKNLRTPLISSVNYKWIGGTLTNWKQVSKSVLTFALFSERCENFLMKNKIDFPRYTKVKKCFNGLLYKKNHKMRLAFNQKPDLIFLINPNENQAVLNEAERLHIPVIALTESSLNPKGVTYPIPVNNYSIQFLYYCLKKIVKITQI